MAITFENMHLFVDSLRALPRDETILKAYVRRHLTEKTRGELLDDIDRFSAAVIARGYRGKRVGILGANSYGWLLAFVALQNTESIPVLLDKEIPYPELYERAHRTHVEVLLSDPDNLENAQRLAEAEHIPLHLLDPDEDEAYSCLWTEQVPMPAHWAATQTSRDLTCIMFTAGTTGESKVVLTASAGVFTVRPYGEEYFNPASVLAVLPFHHAAGWMYAFDALRNGQVLYIVEGPQYMFKCIEMFQPEGICLMPKLLMMLAEGYQNPRYRDSLRCIRTITTGSATVPGSLVGFFEEHNVFLYTRYAMTETAAIATSCLLTRDNPNTIGKVTEGIEVALDGDELVVRGPSLMLGYEGVDNRETFRDGWLHTGDLAYRDSEGYYYLIGRCKNLIILSNGENVSPEKIEQKLLFCNAVRDVAVWEEEDRLAATVRLNAPEDTAPEEKQRMEETVRAFLDTYNQEAPVYEKITYLHFQEEEFRRNSFGKIIREAFNPNIREKK